VRGRGLEGDRYFDAARRMSRDPRRAVDVTLIAAEALDALAAEHGLSLTAAESRRNVLTRGLELDALVDRQFRVGGAILRGLLPCHPCRHLELLIGKPVLGALAGRGGLRAVVVATGWLAVGDAVQVEAPAPARAGRAREWRSRPGSDPALPS
ncbi:MAG TPA: MOSC domain-containing protein, partial [Longimicrobiales bacterium]|nr:MOSC domain-containing protein [Longimicrobiales bacterium]